MAGSCNELGRAVWEQQVPSGDNCQHLSGERVPQAAMHHLLTSTFAPCSKGCSTPRLGEACPQIPLRVTKGARLGKEERLVPRDDAGVPDWYAFHLEPYKRCCWLLAIEIAGFCLERKFPVSWEEFTGPAVGHLVPPCSPKMEGSRWEGLLLLEWAA